MTEPKLLRKEILSKRNELTQSEITTKSNAIRTALLSQKEILHANNIFIYVNFRSEVQTTSIISELLSSGKQVSVPLTRVDERRLEIVKITDPENELIPGYCDIPEPKEELVHKQSISPHLLDVIILPGSVFDSHCGRFGYGGGFYDRLLASIPKAARIALAFEVQTVGRLPLQDHDELLDCTITEERVIRCTRQ